MGFDPKGYITKIHDRFDKLTKKQKIFSLIALGLVLLILLGVLVGNIISNNRTELVKNGSFESWTLNNLSGWSTYNYLRDFKFITGGVTISKDSNEFSDGKDSACINITESNDVRLYQTVKVKSSTYYKITASFKVEGLIEKGYGAGISIYDHELSFPAVGATMNTENQWMELTVYGLTGEDQESLQLAVGLGGFGADSSGKIWIDNVSMVKVDQVPEGTDVYNFYKSPESGADVHVLKLSENASRWIFRLLILVVAVYVICLIVKNSRRNKSREDEIKDGNWQPGMKVINKKELLIISVMTLIYLVVALYNLGDMKAPETYYAPQLVNRNESVVVAFDGEKDISRILYHTNLDALGRKEVGYKVEYLDSSSNEYVTIEYTDSEGNKTDLIMEETVGFYKWHYHNVNFRTSKIRITLLGSEVKISEFGFFEEQIKDGVEQMLLLPVTIEEIIPNSSSKTPSKLEDYQKWFDEQDLVVEMPSIMNSTYFDEVYFPRTAYENINGLSIYETTHPPLGKLIQALGILIFGMNPFGWRIMGTLFGAAMIPIMYLLAKKLFNSSFFAFAAAALIMFDTMHFAQTRLATIDSFSVVFIMLMYYFMYDVFICKSYEVKYKKYVISLFLSGLFFGIGASTKWICLYAAFGLAILFFISKLQEINSYKKLGLHNPVVKEEKWYMNFYIDNVSQIMIICVFFFVIIPIIIYYLSYIPYAFAGGERQNLIDIVWTNQKSMYSYHSQLTSGHPYSSEWWEWIIDWRPIWYYQGSDVASGMRSTIASFGNPVIWYAGIISLFSAAYIAIKKADKKMVFILVGYACQLFPWMIVFRATFIYHYFSCLPFLILCIVYVLKHLYDTMAIKKWVVVAFVVLVAAVFILFYPAISGYPVAESYIAKLRILPNWWF